MRSPTSIIFLSLLSSLSSLGDAAPAPAPVPVPSSSLDPRGIPAAVPAIDSSYASSSSSSSSSSSALGLGGQWDSGAVTTYPIHSSCNATERRQLEYALSEAMILANHAREHILRYGATSRFFTKYFGNASTAEPAGWYDRLVNADKAGIWFRCDDVDENCHQEGWAGYHRTSNASTGDETVICPLSYSSRKPLTQMCSGGYTVSGSKNTVYFASDLLHRIYHLPRISEEIVDHYADSYKAVLELATRAPELAVRNSASLRYFALDVYAWDVAVPGEGCSGLSVAVEADVPAEAAKTTGAAEATATGPATETKTADTGTGTGTSTGTSTSTSTAKETASVTKSAAQECHTHADGVVHCV